MAFIPAILMQVIQSHRDGYDLALKFQFNWDIVKICQKIKTDFGTANFRYDPDVKVWLFNYDLFESVLGYFKDHSMYVPDWVMDRVTAVRVDEQKELEEFNELMNDELETDIVCSCGEDHKPYPYQKIGANFLMKLKKGMCNDEMGLGKSLQALIVAHMLKLKTILIICPNSIKENWKGEVRHWLNRTSYIVEDRAIPGYVNIINYERLGRFAHQDEKDRWIIDEKFLDMWDMVIVDECHYIKEAKSKRTKLVLQITEKAERVALLTGTPILNRPKELVTQIKAIGRLRSDFGGATKFKERYCAAYFGAYGYDDKGAGNLSELKKKLQKFAIRRMKKQVLKDLPDKFVHTTTLDLYDPFAYNQIETECAKSFNEVMADHKDFYKSLAGKSDIERAEMLVDRKGSDAYKAAASNVLTMISRLRQETARQKVLASKFIFDQYSGTDTKVVVFTIHKKTTYDLHSMYGNSLAITGDTKVEDRIRMIEQFQTDKNINFLFGTIKTIGVGFNIVKNVSSGKFIEQAWTPAEHIQAEDRIWRIGQENKVDIDYLIMKDTIDEDIVEMLHNKSEVIEGAVEGKLLNKMILKFMKEK